MAFHTADPKAFFKPLTPDNERWEELSLNPDWWFGDRSRYPYDWWQLIRQLERVIRRHPQTTFLGVHFGCAAEEIEYVADVMREHPNYIVDVAARLGEIGRHDAGTVRAVFLEFQDRILFGSDLGLRREIMLGAPQGFSPTEDDVAAFTAHWRFSRRTRGRSTIRPRSGPLENRCHRSPDDVLRKSARTRWLRSTKRCRSVPAGALSTTTACRRSRRRPAWPVDRCRVDFAGRPRYDRVVVAAGDKVPDREHNGAPAPGSVRRAGSTMRTGGPARCAR